MAMNFVCKPGGPDSCPRIPGLSPVQESSRKRPSQSAPGRVSASTALMDLSGRLCKRPGISAAFSRWRTCEFHRPGTRDNKSRSPPGSVRGLSSLFGSHPPGRRAQEAQSAHGRVGLADNASVGTAEHVPRIGSIIKGPDAKQSFVTELFCRRFQLNPRIDFRYFFLRILPASW